MTITTNLCLAAGFLVALGAGDLSATSTAWQNGRFRLDVPGVPHRSDIFLSRPNTQAAEAMALGNGRLGVAVWAADGFTAQLTRADTLPDRLSPRQVVIPGLSTLTAASDFSGRLDFYDGEIREQGGGMSATIYVEPGTDTRRRCRWSQSGETAGCTTLPLGAADRSAYGPRLHRPALPGLDR
jgi:hypothetical protein